MYAPPRLSILPLRVRLRLGAALPWPQRERGNTLRGAVGMALAAQACTPGCAGQLTCSDWRACAYARVFRPQWSVPGRQGFCPSPYLLRPPLDDDSGYGAGQEFDFELRLLGRAMEDAATVNRALASLRRVRDTPVEVLNIEPGSVIQLENLAAGPAASSADVTFLTPTELKTRDETADLPTFPLLIKHLTGRLADLCRSCGAAPWTADLGGLRRLAEQAEITTWRGAKVRSYRHSSASGQTHPVGGVIGTVRYSGMDPVLWPLLRMGEQIHVGHGAAWGHGWFTVQPIKESTT